MNGKLGMKFQAEAKAGPRELTQLEQSPFSTLKEKIRIRKMNSLFCLRHSQSARMTVFTALHEVQGRGFLNSLRIRTVPAEAPWAENLIYPALVSVNLTYLLHPPHHGRCGVRGTGVFAPCTSQLRRPTRLNVASSPSTFDLPSCIPPETAVPCRSYLWYWVFSILMVRYLYRKSHQSSRHPRPRPSHVRTNGLAWIHLRCRC
jgi:hypothetical protein